MAKVIGPFMSLDASGTLAGTITAAKWKGRNYLRQRVIPSNPQSNAQTGVRATFGGAVALWKANQVALASAYDALAKQTNVSAFNAFVSTSQKQFSKGFGAANSPTPTNTVITDLPTGLAAVVEGKYITITWTDSIDAGNWATNLYMKLGDDPTQIWTNQIGLVPAGLEKLTIGPLAAGAYHIAAAANGDDGGVSTLTVAVTATVV